MFGADIVVNKEHEIKAFCDITVAVGNSACVSDGQYANMYIATDNKFGKVMLLRLVLLANA